MKGWEKKRDEGKLYHFYCLDSKGEKKIVETKFAGLTFCHPPNLGGFEWKRVIKKWKKYKINPLTFNIFHFSPLTFSFVTSVF